MDTYILAVSVGDQNYIISDQLPPLISRYTDGVSQPPWTTPYTYTFPIYVRVRNILSMV